MDWEPTRTALAAAARMSRPQGQSKPRAKWVSQQELARRKEANECLRYGSGDYYSRECSLAPARKSNIAQTPARKPKVRIIAVKAKAKKKKSTPTPITTDKAGSEEETDSATESENE